MINKMSQYVAIAQSQRRGHHLLAVDSGPWHGGFPKHPQTISGRQRISAQYLALFTLIPHTQDPTSKFYPK